jgi:beta-carotene/zeaxanthin 4-ketolase
MAFDGRTFPVWQTSKGISLACVIVGAWLALHLWGVFFFDFAAQPWWLAAAPVVVQCWLYVGLFIIAHDCMHGSLAPGRQNTNRRMGQLAVSLYAGFSYDLLLRNHMLHHRESGTKDDPDFGHPQPLSIVKWYGQFMAEYMHVRMFSVMSAQVLIYTLVFGVSVANIIVFWLLPAVLSSMQLFYFGTYLPHRPDAQGFDDRHNARSNDYPPWLSLITCFHFGYHHEHHLKPGEPWWRLPAVRSARKT